MVLFAGGQFRGAWSTCCVEVACGATKGPVRDTRVLLFYDCLACPPCEGPRTGVCPGGLREKVTCCHFCMHGDVSRRRRFEPTGSEEFDRAAMTPVRGLSPWSRPSVNGGHKRLPSVMRVSAIVSGRPHLPGSDLARRESWIRLYDVADRKLYNRAGVSPLQHAPAGWLHRAGVGERTEARE